MCTISITLTGEDDEFRKLLCEDDFYQNVKMPGVFRKGGVDYYLDAIAFKCQDGKYFSGMANGISSKQQIKGYPFTPKSFTLNLDENCKVIKDDKFNEARKYYNI